MRDASGVRGSLVIVITLPTHDSRLTLHGSRFMPHEFGTLIG